MRQPPLSRAGVAITGMGAVSAHGSGCAAIWDAVAAGRSGIRPLARFSTGDYSTHLGAEVPGWEDPRYAEGPIGTGILCRSFAREAAWEAWRDAGMDRTNRPVSRLALVLGSGLGEVGSRLHVVAEELARELGIGGPVLTVSTACSSSTNALGWARYLVMSGVVDVVLAGGVDVLTPEVFAGFHALGVLGQAACAPFSLPPGTTLGEGAGFMVLEPAESAVRRNQAVHAHLDGYGSSGDAYHETSPEPGGRGVARALSGALESSGLSPGQIDYVNAHGSGTPANDQAEWRGIRAALGERADAIPVSSTKGSLGHAQGAAGVLEAIATVQGMNREKVPPSLNFTTARPFCPTDPVGQAEPRVHRVSHAATLNSAFGGANAALIISRSESPPRPPAGRRVYVLGTGAVSPAGLGPGADAGERGCGLPACGRVPDFDLRDYLPRADPRGLDPMARFLSAAAAIALAEAGVAITGKLREAAGLIVGCREISPESLGDFHRSIADRGLARLSATAFARIVMNAPAGFCSKLLALRGPHLTLSAGPDSGLAAILAAVMVLAGGQDTRLMVAGGMDELSKEAPPEAGEGAGCVALATSPKADGAAIEVAGWSLKGPGRGPDAVAEVLEQADRTSGSGAALYADSIGAELRDLMRPLGAACSLVDYGTWARQAPTAGPIWAVAEAIRAIRAGDIRRAVVVSSAGRSCSAAILLTATE